MLRFLYLLSLLLCIELSFCYNYIEEVSDRIPNKLGRHVRRERIKRVRRPKDRKSLLRHVYDYDRSPVAFDVASFIQPDEVTLDEDESIRQRNNKRRRTSKNFDYGLMGMGMGLGIGVDDGNKKRDKSPDYLNMGDSPPDLNINPPLFKDAINAKHLNYNSLDDLHSEKYGHEKFRNIYKEDLLLDQNVVHNHEKKCTLKHIKFPFFSHNKSEPIKPKPKKNKKRKLFSFNIPTNEEHGLKLNQKGIDDPIIHYKIKRSFEEKLCPRCKNKFLANTKVKRRCKKVPKRVIHNSRQFFQTNVPVQENVKNLRKNNVLCTEDVLNPNYRKKREETDRQRQLKELEEVQKKVDNVEIRLPAFQKQSNSKSNKI